MAGMSFDRAALSRVLAAQGAVVRVVVAEVLGSAPRDAGAAMLVWASGGVSLMFLTSLMSPKGVRRIAVLGLLGGIVDPHENIAMVVGGLEVAALGGEHRVEYNGPRKSDRF